MRTAIATGREVPGASRDAAGFADLRRYFSWNLRRPMLSVLVAVTLGP